LPSDRDSLTPTPRLTGQGGFCAFSYAARHPDMFLGAGSFSGAIDTARYPAAQAFLVPL
jgi:S-formylglutathione hydrolase FrmB